MGGSLLAIGTACLFFGMLSTIEVRADSDFKVTLIGTGSPIPRPIGSGQVLSSRQSHQRLCCTSGSRYFVRQSYPETS
jgi:hypothetical protein